MSKFKIEKITLWVATETYFDDDTNTQGTPEETRAKQYYLSALDYIYPTLQEHLPGECHILDSETEDYKLIPTDET